MEKDELQASLEESEAALEVCQPQLICLSTLIVRVYCVVTVCVIF